MKLAESPITRHFFNGQPFFLKRDDLLHSQFTGNKARKFMSLLEGDFPLIDTLVGYGSAQANSLYSLAVLCACRGWRLVYFVDHIPSFVKQKPMGNYRAAQDLGAEIVDLSQAEDRNGRHASEYIQDNFGNNPNILTIPEGGRSPLAEEGVKKLAQEILDWKVMERHENLTVALPAGTGTTALYLQKHLGQCNIDVLTCACVGGEDYLRMQFNELDSEAPHPTILGTEIKHPFGRLIKENYEIWKELEEQTHVEFELLYDPLMWRCLKKWIPENQDKTLLYIHQGGTMGNETMLPRYQRKFDKKCGNANCLNKSVKADW
ncbi:pyridoxal-phosphate dependent enzyme [Vibrio sp. JC009]|uniref:pyridoxal-phosphate dependent enzyme n=1 Tax=Vibrio sp. JC009 TaxID=2912314 RepID=UPI0023AE73E8|nr:pyridoxal-phosphate dependent enzyme [Vibrio sp. JC009]WED22908.1 pyridoxal-phosphate dependent enzyme [Vibrio sp. JC009]